MSRSEVLGKKIRGSSGKYLGRPSLCGNEPGKKACLAQLQSLNPGVCRNCHAVEILTERIKIFGG